MMIDAEIQTAISAIETKYGKGTILLLGDDSFSPSEDVIPTGSITLDVALGIGGIPRGRITEIYGPESSGKTTLVQSIIASAQRQGGNAGIVDSEHALDRDYAARCGCDIRRLWICQPDFAEQALEITEDLVRSGKFSVVAVDSVAALVPKAELSGEMGEMQVGGQARLMSHALRKLVGAVSKSNTALIFTNQLREKIGVMFGNPETTPGGRALKFYSSLRLEVRRGEVYKKGDQQIGSETKVKVVKNKMAPPLRTAVFDILFGEGISRESDLIEFGVSVGVLKKAGAFYSFGDTRIGQGRENAREFLKQHPSMTDDIERLIREKINA